MPIEQRVPFIPEGTLRRYRVYEPSDSRYRSAARLRQALWRQQHGWRIGCYTTAKGTRRSLGNYLDRKAARGGANFVSAEIAQLVRRELAYREEGALLAKDRLGANLLSSGPLVFNVFGPMKLDLKLATRVFRRLCPDFVRRVTDIRFEHAPERGSARFTADFTAFDLLVECETPAGERAFCAVEVKLSETMTEPEPRMRPRYDELSLSSGLFKDAACPGLRSNPLQQLWRQHMLSQAMADQGLYTAGRFIVIAPRLNAQVNRAILLYRDHLAESPDRVTFGNLDLETVIGAMKHAGARDLAGVLYDRYCNFDPVDSLI